MTSTTERNKGVVKRFLEAWNDRKADVFDQVVAANVVRHCQATPAVEIHSLAQLKQFLQQDCAIFPDSVQTIRHLVAEGNLVAAWCRYEGTQQGPMGPFPPSGARVDFDFGAVFNMESGKITEWWVTWDNMTILRQLGHLPSDSDRDRPA
jgi:steroid delta-isomerase-like uncharacterized protein